MRIAIDNLQSENLMSEIDTSAGEEIVGGGLIDASSNIFSFSNNSYAKAAARIFGSGSNVSGNIIANAETGKGFSRSFTFVSVTSS